VILPEENEKDLEEIPAEVADQMEFTRVSHMDQVLEVALVSDVEAQVAPGTAETQGALPPPMPH